MRALRRGLLLAIGCAAVACAERSDLETIDALEDARDLGRGRLIAYADDTAGGLRARAARAMGRIGDPSVVPVLGRLLDDRDPAVVGEAAYALGRIARVRPEHSATVASLLRPHLERVTDHSPETARRLVWAAAGVGEHDLTWWRTIPTPPLDAIAGELALALRHNPSANELVVSLLRHPDPEVRWRAAIAAQHRASSRVVEALGVAAGDDDPRVRRESAVALGSIGSETAAHHLQQRLELGEWDPHVLVATLSAFEGVRVSTAAVSTVEKYIHSPSPYARAAACRALAALGGLAAESAVLTLSEDANSLVRAEAATALRGFEFPACLEALRRLSRDSSPAVRANAVLGLRTPDDRPLVVAAATDATPIVRAAAVRSLVALDGSRQAVEAAASDRDPSVVVAAIEAASDAGVWAMDDILQRYRPGAAPQVRRALLDALQGCGDATACSFAPFWVDDDPAIRRAAAIAAAARGRDACSVPDLATLSRRSRSVSGAGRRVDSDRLERRASLVTDAGTIDIRLFPRSAPRTVAHFLDLVRDGIFEGVVPCEIEPTSMVIFGCRAGGGSIRTGRVPRAEPGSRRVVRGVLGMWEPSPGDPDAEFFIALSPAPELDGFVTVFGEVELGLEVTERLTPDSRVLRVFTR